MKGKVMQTAAVVIMVALVLLYLLRPKADIAQDEARTLVRDGATLVDVRSSGEFASGHVDGAINIPVGSIDSRHGELSRDKPIVLYCASGMRSARAASILRAEGFERVHNVGAMPSW